MSDDKPAAAGSDPGVSPPTVLGLESGTYESDADPGHVWVRRDNTGETVRARYTGYPGDFVFEPGDETGIELVDGTWHTLPSVTFTARLPSRIEWWTSNRTTGQFRFLKELAIRPGIGSSGNPSFEEGGA